MRFYKVKETGAYAFHTILEEWDDLSFTYKSKLNIKKKVYVLYDLDKTKQKFSASNHRFKSLLQVTHHWFKPLLQVTNHWFKMPMMLDVVSDASLELAFVSLETGRDSHLQIVGEYINRSR